MVKQFWLMVASINFFNVVIFSAGSGKRLWPKTCSTPKLFVKVGRQTMFDHTVKFFIKSYLCRKTYIVFREKRRSYLHVLKKLSGIKLVKNRFSAESHCASSLYTIYEKLDGGTIFFNSDLILNKSNLVSILKEVSNTNRSLVFGINKNSVEKECDLQRVKLNDRKKIVSWSIELADFDSYVTGPVYLCGKDLEIIKSVLDKANVYEVIKLPCFTFFSELIDNISFNFREIDTYGFSEIDTLKDLKMSMYKKWVN